MKSFCCYKLHDFFCDSVSVERFLKLNIMAVASSETAVFYIHIAVFIMNIWGFLTIICVAWHLLSTFFNFKIRNPWYFNSRHHFNHLIIFKGTWWLRSGIYWTFTRISYLGLIIMITQECVDANLLLQSMIGEKDLKDKSDFNSTFIHELSHHIFWFLFWSFLICRILRYLSIPLHLNHM